MDLKDFFLSIGAARVNAVFSALGYPTQAARTLAGLCTNRVGNFVLDAKDAAKYDFELPQLSWEECKRYRVDDFRAHLCGRIAHCAMLNPARGAHLKALFARIAW